MIKRLKRKKGFTLLELIVVFAIIGVLAAILIPTLLGFVTSSRVSSANSTAVKLRDEVNRWLVTLDSKGAGMLSADSSTDYLEVVCENGKWKIKTNVSKSDSWKLSSENDSVDGKSDELISVLNLNYASNQQSAFTAYLVAGMCKYLVYNPNSNEPITDFGSFKADGTLDWKYDENKFSDEGVLKGGTIIGTAPAITK